VWNCADHSSDIMLFNQQGEVLFSKDGKLSEDEIRTMIDLIWKHIGGKPANAAQK
jgi:predicted transcriptional regulator